MVLNRMRAFQGAIGISSQRGLVSPDYLVLRPSESAEARYLHHLFRSTWFVGEMASRLRGIGNTENGSVRTPRINPEDLGDILVDLPELDEQRRIADFLDAETARIDKLASAYQMLESLVTERKQHIIDELAAGAGELVPMKYHVRFREGPGIMAADFREFGTPLIRIAGLKHGLVTLNGANFLDEKKVATRWPQFRLRLGDYLISGSATMGSVSVVQDESVAGAIPYTGLIILRPAHERVAMEYVATVLQSSLFTRQIDLLKAGAMIQHFGPTHLAQVALPFPEKKCQEAVAATAHEITVHAAEVSSTAGHQLALLAERRQALITAAVTGKLDVTTARRAAVV